MLICVKFVQKRSRRIIRANKNLNPKSPTLSKRFMRKLKITQQWNSLEPFKEAFQSSSSQVLHPLKLGFLKFKFKWSSRWSILLQLQESKAEQKLYRIEKSCLIQKDWVLSIKNIQRATKTVSGNIHIDAAINISKISNF